MAGNLTNLEIFGTGTHRAQSGTVTVTDDDLDHIVDAFNSLQGSNIVRPHLKLGHTDAQRWFGQKDGIPTLGFITKVWRQGRKLLADISEVPDELIQMIKSGRFHNVSAEVFWNAPIELDGRKFPRVLSAVSILGVEMPAVKDLAGLANALFKSEPLHQFTGEEALYLDTINTKEDTIMPDNPGSDDKGLFSQEHLTQLVDAAVKTAVEDVKAEFSDEVKDLSKKLEVSDLRAEQAEGELGKVKLAAINSEAENIVKSAVKDGKLLPKQQEFALAVLTAPATMIKFGDGEKSMVEVFKDFLDAQGTVVDTSESGNGENKITNFSTASQEVDYKSKELQKTDPKMTYEDAWDKVLASDEELKIRYTDMQA